MKVTVLGAGAWGTALTKVLQQGGHTITLWGHDPARVAEMRRTGRNDRYLPGIESSARVAAGIRPCRAPSPAREAVVSRTALAGLSHGDRPTGRIQRCGGQRHQGHRT